jgi:hypothetical protein
LPLIKSKPTISPQSIDAFPTPVLIKEAIPIKTPANKKEINSGLLNIPSIKKIKNSKKKKTNKVSVKTTPE